MNVNQEGRLVDFSKDLQRASMLWVSRILNTFSVTVGSFSDLGLLCD